MSPTTYSLLHYEDEPLTVAWLEESIYLELCEHFPSFATCDEDTVVSRNQERRQITFRVPPGDHGGEGLEVSYRICTTQEEFFKALDEIVSPDNTVIILDLMEQGEEELITSGVECYKKIPASIPIGKRFFLSGYADQIRKLIPAKIEDHSVFRKPVNVSNFTAAILKALHLALER